MGKFLALEKKYQLIIIFLIIVFIISAGYKTGAQIKGMAFKEQSSNEIEISSEKKEWAVPILSLKSVICGDV